MKQLCPRCGYQLDADDPVTPGVERGGKENPAPGDLGVCIACAAPLMFQADGSRRWMTFKEVIALPDKAGERGCQHLLMTIFAILTMRPTKLPPGRTVH